MPPKNSKKTKASGMKKVGGRRYPYRRFRKTVNINRALQPFAQRYIANLRYSEVITTNQGVYAMRLNSLFDPNYTGTGHQPYGFDQLAAIYNKYRCISTAYRIEVITTSLGATPIQVCVLPACEEAGIFSLSEMRETSRAKYVVQYPGAAAKTLKGKVYLPSLQGRNRSQYMSDNNYAANVNANPNELALLNILTGTLGTDGISSVSLIVTMTFKCEFFDPKKMPQS